MNNKTLVIHPRKGCEDEIMDIVECYDGLAIEKKILGMPIIEANFMTYPLAKHCKEALEGCEPKLTGHIDWKENA